MPSVWRHKPRTQSNLQQTPIFHSDRGAQYTSAELADAARLMDIRLSVGRTGVCWDNAVAESFFASLKRERWHRRQVPATRVRARVEVADYIEVFYNRSRLHSTLGYRAPAVVMGNFFSRYPMIESSEPEALAAGAPRGPLKYQQHSVSLSTELETAHASP